MPQARTLISKLKTIFIFFSFIAMATLLSLSVQPLLQDVTSIHIACILKIRCGYGALFLISPCSTQSHGHQPMAINRNNSSDSQ